MRWAAAMEQSLYGPAGFFTSQHNGGPTAHFRTSATASPLFARAIVRLLEAVDSALDHPEHLDVVDIAAGRGELLVWLLSFAHPELATRIRPVAVELAERPGDLPASIQWVSQPPDGITGLIIATEWLDNVPLDIAEATEDGPRYVLVDEHGAESAGQALEPDDTAWITEWWPLGEQGARVEIGRPRDSAWAGAVAGLDRGLALAVDYGHLRHDRPPFGTLTGYREGRQVAPVPDGTCDLTAHVAMDSAAQAGAVVADATPSIIRQRTALHLLGVDGTRPGRDLASADPAGYLRRLGQASEAAELTDPAGLGGHLWLFQPRGISSPGIWNGNPDAGAVGVAALRSLGGDGRETRRGAVCETGARAGRVGLEGTLSQP